MKELDEIIEQLKTNESICKVDAVDVVIKAVLKAYNLGFIRGEESMVKVIDKLTGKV